MTATEQLRAEHEGIRLMLRILERFAEKLEKGESVDLDHGVRIIEFFQVFADTCHHGKEEALLFPALEGMGVPKEGGPIGVMLHEHDMGRSYVRSMAGNLEKCRTGNKGAGIAFAESAKAYIRLLNDHIDKENNVLFPSAEKLLSDERQAELAEGFETIETEKIGAGKHEEFHALLDRLKKLYLG